MTVYQRRQFTFEPIENTPENQATVESYGYNPSMIGLGSVLVRVIELDVIEAVLPSMAEFEARFEPLPE